ncbi:MAG TPA: M23 family metallopeptidase [Chthoniobacterales bacterium]
MSRLLFLVVGLGFGSFVSVATAQLSVVSLRVTDGFDFPLGKPNAEGYYKSRGFTPHGHLGEDWVSEAGSGAVFRHPVYSVGVGVVTLARDFRRAWGNAVVIRHAYLEEGQLKYVDSLYGHLDRILVSEGQRVERGQQIGTVGTAHGLYPPHLHFEVHHNLAIGVCHTGFATDYSNYDDPTSFVERHRALKPSNEAVSVTLGGYAMPSFAGIPARPAAVGQRDGRFVDALRP